MLLKSGFPYYLIRYGLVNDYSKLEKSIETDVLVIGGGISGALCAYLLMERGINTVVIDARSIGLGSTCASTSLVQYELDIPLHKLGAMIGVAKAARAWLLCRDSIDKLATIAKTIGFTDFNKKESLYYAASRKDSKNLKKEFDARRQAGFHVHWLEKNDVKQQAGMDAVAAILSGDGAETNFYLFTHYLHRYGIKKGLRVFDRSEAVSFDHHKNSWQVKMANGSLVHARRLVFASGYESVQYVSKKIVTLTSTYAIASESISPGRPFWKHDRLLWNTADPYLYIRSTPDNRILVGGRDEPFYSPKRRDALIHSKKQKLASDFRKLFPAIPFEPEFGWAGTFSSTKDSLPYIGEYPGWKDAYFALGYGGNGINFSLIAAELIAGLLKDKSDKDLELFSFNR
jgi:glycine/D-amino acid oxidase-like deaminating enzyme